MVGVGVVVVWGVVVVVVRAGSASVSDVYPVALAVSVPAVAGNATIARPVPFVVATVLEIPAPLRVTVTGEFSRVPAAFRTFT